MTEGSSPGTSDNMSAHTLAGYGARGLPPSLVWERVPRFDEPHGVQGPSLPLRDRDRPRGDLPLERQGRGLCHGTAGLPAAHEKNPPDGGPREDPACAATG